MFGSCIKPESLAESESKRSLVTVVATINNSTRSRMKRQKCQHRHANRRESRIEEIRVTQQFQRGGKWNSTGEAEQRMKLKYVWPRLYNEFA